MAKKTKYDPSAEMEKLKKIPFMNPASDSDTDRYEAYKFNILVVEKMLKIINKTIRIREKAEKPSKNSKKAKS